MCFKTVRSRVEVIIADPTDETFSLEKQQAVKALAGVALPGGGKRVMIGLN